MRRKQDVLPASFHLDHLPIEVQLRIAEYVGWKNLAQKARTSRAFNQLSSIFFVETAIRTNPDFAKMLGLEFIQSVKQLEKTDASHFKPQELSKTCFNLLQKLHHGYIYAQEMQLKSNLGKLYNNYTARYLPLITAIPDNIRVRLYSLNLDSIMYSQGQDDGTLLQKVIEAAESLIESDFSSKPSESVDLKLKRLFQRLHEVFFNKNAMSIRTKIIAIYEQLMKDLEKKFNKESIRAEMWLLLIDMQLAMLAKGQSYTEFEYGVRLLLLSKSEEFIATLSEKNNKKLIAHKIIAAIEQFIKEPPKFQKDNDKRFYFSEMNNILDSWKHNLTKSTPGCVIS